MVFRYCFGMIMSVSTLMIFNGAATPSSVVKFSIDRTSLSLGLRKSVLGLSRMAGALKGQISLLDLRLDRLHVGVRQPKMMADLVDQHVTDDMAQGLLVLGPIVQDRPAIQPDHVGQPRQIVVALMRQSNALEQAEQLELALGLHFVEHLIGGEIVDANDDPLAQLAKTVRKAFEHSTPHASPPGGAGRCRA